MRETFKRGFPFPNEMIDRSSAMDTISAMFRDAVFDLAAKEGRVFKETLVHKKLLPGRFKPEEWGLDERAKPYALLTYEVEIERR